MTAAAQGQPLLATERLDLRRVTADDADVLTELDSDPEVMHFINGGRPTPHEEIVTDVVPAFLAHYERWPWYGFFLAHERATGEVIGWFHLRPSSGTADDDPELGYRLRRRAWGRGFATEGSLALVDLAFERAGATRVHAEAMVVHTASRRVMERCGMEVVRVFHQEWPDRIPGDEHGDVEYAITREAWLRRRTAAG